MPSTITNRMTHRAKLSISFSALWHLLSEFLPASLFNFVGGSYKKIGYYDSSKGNLSWYGNDKWIGETDRFFFSPLSRQLSPALFISFTLPVRSFIFVVIEDYCFSNLYSRGGGSEMQEMKSIVSEMWAVDELNTDLWNVLWF